MGIEYKIDCDAKGVAEFDAFLRRQPYFESHDAERSLCNLRVPEIAENEVGCSVFLPSLFGLS